MLRVEGLKRAYARKSEEVRRSKRAVDDAHNVADYSLYMHGLESKSIRMEQAEKAKALQQQIDQLKNQVDQLQASLEDANKKLEEQKEPLQRLSKAETENGRLAKENERLRKEAAAANENFKATLESEQERLIEENEHDCAMLRVSSLKGPLNEKTREVKAANVRAASTLDKAQFEIAQNEILTLDMLYSQASTNLQNQQNLDAAKQRVQEFQEKVKGLKEKLETLKEAESKASNLGETVKRLRGWLCNQETQLRTKYRSLMEEEKQDLVKQVMDDNEVVMRAS
ncbi:tropomyosin-2-like [Chenopodium quinoa]|uniref:tropomyosin-2-like n=1 Tax=Chenopodium quinoa TaxID=63459 RepID=UPI000B790E06|nr:tropomyosin-2-like [Chenopodium quinoa]